MSFKKLGLFQSILKTISEQGYETPTAIQEKSIPAILNGRDVIATAQTGTGKTAAFVLPILQQLSQGAPAKSRQVRCLILTPTRELAAQIGENVISYSRNLNIRSAVVYGGVNTHAQIRTLLKGVDLLVATPGRLMDLYQQQAVRFAPLEFLVLDEADRMLDMGFIHDIQKIITYLPRNRQNLMFSATLPKTVQQLARKILFKPLEISATPRNTAAVTISHWMYSVEKIQKIDLFIRLLEKHNWHQALIFTRTKYGADKLTKKMNKARYKAVAIHGDKRQGARTRALADFKSGKVPFLVATDIAARGLDIEQLPVVINFDLPNVPEDYVHRIGRTGRAGEKGQAISLVSPDEQSYLSGIERLLKQTIQKKNNDFN